MYSYGKQSEETNETNSYEDRSNWKARKYSYGYGEPDNSGETDAGSPYSQESDSRSPYSQEQDSRSSYSPEQDSRSSYSQESDSRSSYSYEKDNRSSYSYESGSRTPYSSDPEDWQGNPSGEAYKSRLANLSIAASIAGFLSMLIPYLTLPLGIMALLFGILSLIRGEYSRGRAVTGIVLGSCLILIGGTLIICVSALSPYADDLTRIFMEYMQHMQPVR